MKKLIFLIVFILSFTKILWAEKEARPHAHEEKEHAVSDTHDDHDEENHDEHGKHDKHKRSSGHAHEEHSSATKKAGKGHSEGDEHGEKNAEHKDEHGEEEANSAVGHDKGILEKGEDGFKLSPEAIKSFQLKTQNFENFRAQFPRLTLVEIKEDKFVYRLRDGWIKKIPVKLIKKEKDVVTLELSQFKVGDQVIVSGTGFVRVSELVAEEGMAEGHSH